MKSGRFSREEQQYIIDNVYNMTYDSMAKKLDRDPESVKSYIIKKLGYKVSLTEGGQPVVPDRGELQNREFWNDFKEQFSEEELSFFAHRWADMHEQFKNDVFPTEEMQIIDAIKIRILMNRNLKAQRQSLKLIEVLDAELTAEEQKPMEDRDYPKIIDLQKQISFQRTSQAPLNRDYKDLQDQENKLLAGLKATRADRIKRVESSRESFIGWITEIINDAPRREELGKYMEKMRLSAIDEEVRLSAYHKYIDGEIDMPLYNADSIKLNEDYEKKKGKADAQKAI